MNSRRRTGLLHIAQISLMSALTVICSLISVPTVPPFTLQTLAVFLSLYLLGGRRGFISVLIYAALGALGLPVFAGFSGGIGHLLGASGGFIIGFVVGAAVYAFCEMLFPKSDAVKIVLSLILQIIIYIIGALWFASVYTSDGSVGFISALSVCVLPYIIPDAIKLMLAVIIYKKFKKHMNIGG